MDTYTLDHNAILDLEEGALSAPALRDLIELHDRGKICVQLAAVGASERLGDKSQALDYSLFEQRLVGIGLSHLPVVAPLRIWGLTYWGHDLWGDEGGAMTQLVTDLIKILAPTSGKLTERNRCDILTMWTHIHHGGDVFVTRDKDFLKVSRKTSLENLGARCILAPQNALGRAQRS